MSENIIRQTILEAMAPAVEMQLLANKQALTPSEVEKLYGISKTRLDHLRGENRGPQYTQLAERGAVLYTPAAIQRWLQMNSTTPKAV